MLIKQFIKLLESGKYKIDITRFAGCTGFYKIMNILFNNSNKEFAYEHLLDMFKDTDMINVNYKFGSRWRAEIPYILPKHDNTIEEPTAFPDYVELYGLKSFISVLKRTFL